MKRNVNTVEAKNRLNELLAEVERTHHPIIVERRGVPVAVVVDYESYRSQLEHTEPRRTGADPVWKAMQTLHDALAEKYPQGTGDAVEILRDIRQSRHST